MLHFCSGISFSMNVCNFLALSGSFKCNWKIETSAKKDEILCQGIVASNVPQFALVTLELRIENLLHHCWQLHDLAQQLIALHLWKHTRCMTQSNCQQGEAQH